MRVLILGGTGVISHYVVEKYRDMGHQVTVINRGNRKELNIEDVEYITGNTNSREGLVARVGANFYDKVLDFVTYDKDVMRMKMEILQIRCNHYIFISSVAAYERNSEAECYTEEMSLGNGKWPYGRRKSECEEVLREMYEGNTASCYTIIRPGITCGEMFIPYSPIDSYNMPGYLIHCILTGKEILTSNIEDDRMQVIHASDTAENLYALLNRQDSRNECFNLCGDEYITSNQVLERLSSCLGVQAVACYVPQSEFVGRAYMQPIVEGGWHDRYSNQKVKKVLGEEYHTGKKVLDNLQDAVEFFLRHYDYTGWSEVTEKQIRQVIAEAKVKGKAEVKYISTYKDEGNNWAALYSALDFKIHRSEILSGKRRLNEEFLARWLRLEMRQIHLVDYFCRRGITRLCLYGYGVLGRHVAMALEGSPIEILCVIDRGVKSENSALPLRRSATGMEEEYILVSVMSDTWSITSALKEQGCKHIIDLGHIFDILEREDNGDPYPEMMKYRNMDIVKELELANFGTGLGYYDFCYEGLPVCAFNFSLPQQSLEFDYKLMKHYQDKLLPGCVMCLVLPYCIFMANHILEVDEINERYYTILPAGEVEGRCNTSYAAYIRRNGEGQYLATADDYAALELKRPSGEKDREGQIQTLLDCWKRQLGIVSFDSGIEFPGCRYEIEMSVKWLKRILRFCRKKCLKPVVIVPPMSQDLLDKIGWEFRQVFFYNILKENVDEGIPVLDYTADETFCNPSFYATPCFLVKEKARIFTIDVLRKIGIL